MILDLFMVSLFIGGFVVGWWCRAKFGSAEAMIDAGSAKMKSMFKKDPTVKPAPVSPPAVDPNEKF